jgi:orotidine-5'-phosphate decarboxylase
MSRSALDRLQAAAARTGGVLSVGLEPSPDYLPAGFAPTFDGYASFLKLIVEETRDLACAYKFNLGFFESLGVDGARLLEQTRALVPDDAFLIVDGKRGDIGSTAQHYARACFESLGADAATVNPLMGRDAAMPFLEYTDKLTFFLVVTSNPGAGDFLLVDGLYRRIARHVVGWAEHGNAGFVVGATRADRVEEVRNIAPEVPFLVPGVGAQGGEIDAVVQSGRGDAAHPTLLFHVTRGILPQADDPRDAGQVIRERAEGWLENIRSAMRSHSGGRP